MPSSPNESVEVESQPHAYVVFDDDEESKEIVPLHFVTRFPTAWRNSGWDKNYKYKVFWSPEDGDSPSKLLSKLVKIPVYENGNAFVKPGYYRAAVIHVAETKAELVARLEGKRVSVGLMKYRYSSFDGKPEKKLDSGASSKQVPKKVEKNKKIVGIHRKGHLNEIQGITKIVGNLVNTSSDNCVSTAATNINPMRKKTNKPNKSPDMNVAQSEKMADLKINETEDSGSTEYSGTDNSSDIISDITDAATPVEKARKRSSSFNSRSRSGKEKKSQIESDSSNSDFEFEGKKLKEVDPDFTPRKYIEAQDLLKVKDKTIERISGLNLRLQENLVKAQEEEVKLRAKIADLEEKLEKYRQTSVKSEVFLKLDKGNVDDRLKSSGSKPKRTSETSHAAPVMKQRKIQEISGKKSESSDVNEKFKNNSADPVEVKEEITDSDDITAAYMCSVEIDDSLQNDSPPGNHKVRNEADKFDDGALPESVVQYISKLKAGEKADLPFVKSLAIGFFGPEVLAKSTVSGTRKGKRSGEDKKPSLDKTIVKAIRGKLVKRVELEEEIVIPAGDVDDHLRTTAKRFHEILRQIIKRMRELGYGNGGKSSDWDLTNLIK